MLRRERRFYSTERPRTCVSIIMSCDISWFTILFMAILLLALHEITFIFSSKPFAFKTHFAKRSAAKKQILILNLSLAHPPEKKLCHGIIFIDCLNNLVKVANINRKRFNSIDIYWFYCENFSSFAISKRHFILKKMTITIFRHEERKVSFVLFKGLEID